MSEGTMNRIATTRKNGFALVPAAGLLAALLLIGARAAAQWDPPPPEYIATTEPAYYEGHAAYWYNGHWYWRDDHGGWNHYDQEPPALADRRAHFPPGRRSWQGHR
jgi:hypothetical protein